MNFCGDRKLCLLVANLHCKAMPGSEPFQIFSMMKSPLANSESFSPIHNFGSEFRVIPSKLFL